MKVATVLESSCPRFMIRKHRGMISVCMRNVIASVSSPLTKAPITPREVTRRFSKGFCFAEVFKKGYRNRGIYADFYQNNKNVKEDRGKRVTIRN